MAMHISAGTLFPMKMYTSNPFSKRYTPFVSSFSADTHSFSGNRGAFCTVVPSQVDAVGRR